MRGMGRRFPAGMRRSSGRVTSSAPSDPILSDAIAGLSPFRRWRSTNGVVVAGSDVTTWTDVIASQTLVQASAGLYPQYSALDSNWGGKPSLSFDGVNDRLISTEAASVYSFLHNTVTPGGTLIVACRPTGTGNRGIAANASSSIAGIGLYQITTAARVYLYRSDGAGPAAQSAAGAFPVDTRQWIALRNAGSNNTALNTLAGSSGTLMDDGVTSGGTNLAVANHTDTSENSNPGAAFTVGGWIWDNSFFAGSIVEVIIWDRLLTQTEMLSVRGQMQSYWEMAA